MLSDETDLATSITDGDVDDLCTPFYSQVCGERWDIIVLEEVTLCEDPGPRTTQLIVSARVERTNSPRN